MNRWLILYEESRSPSMCTVTVDAETLAAALEASGIHKTLILGASSIGHLQPVGHRISHYDAEFLKAPL